MKEGIGEVGRGRSRELGMYEAGRIYGGGICHGPLSQVHKA